MGQRRHQDDALPVRDRSASEPADSPVEKILVLVELHDVIAWGGIPHHSIPGLTVRLVMLRNRLEYQQNLLADRQVLYDHEVARGGRISSP
jgi:hypothetical protein